MNFAEWLWILINQRADAPCLRAGQVLRNHAASRQDDGIFGVWLFRCGPPFHSLHVRLAVRMRKLATLIESWCARMIERWTGPEDSLFAVDSFPGDSVVIVRTAFRRDAQFFEHVGWRLVGELVADAEASSQIANDLPINSRIGGRIYCFPVMDYTPFDIC